MLDALTAQQWAAQADFPNQLRRWTWAREAWPALLHRLAAAGDAPSAVTIDGTALSRAFWPWAATFDDNVQLEPVEPLDYAHYACGMLLVQLLRQRPVRRSTPSPAPQADRGEDIRVQTDFVLTLLQAWRLALGAGPLDADLPIRLQAHWVSYRQGVFEDGNVAVAFLDLFTGREPVWRYPLMLVERPVFRDALARRRASAV